MDENKTVKAAWQKFAANGRVEDYLNFCRVKELSNVSVMQERDVNEAEHGWLGAQGTEYR